MGWTECHKPSGTSYRKFFQEGLNGTIIDSHTVHGVFYGAVKSNDDGRVSAIVVLVKPLRDKYLNFGYKWMDETVHPYYYRCPDRILNILSETDNEYALEWRAKCKLNNKSISDVKEGTVIQFENVLSFNNGVKLNTFRYVKGNKFTNGGYYYRISNWEGRKFRIIEK